MTTTTFDTLGYSKKLLELGFTREQAEGFAEIQRDIIEDRLATKADLLMVQRDLQAVKLELQQQMKELEYRLTIRLGAMMAVAIAVVAALVRLT